MGRGGGRSKTAAMCAQTALKAVESCRELSRDVEAREAPLPPPGLELGTFGLKTRRRRRDATRPWASSSSDGASYTDWAGASG